MLVPTDFWSLTFHCGVSLDPDTPIRSVFSCGLSCHVVTWGDLLIHCGAVGNCRDVPSTLCLERLPNQGGSRHELRFLVVAGKSLSISLKQGLACVRRWKEWWALSYVGPMVFTTVVTDWSSLASLPLLGTCHLHSCFDCMTAASRNHKFPDLMCCSWFLLNYELPTEVSRKDIFFNWYS